MCFNKLITLFIIFIMLFNPVLAADTGQQKEKVIDDTKEKETKITNKDKSITGDIKVTTKDVSKFSVKKKSNYEILISKSGEHVKAKVSFPKSELQKIDIDGDGKFGLLHISDNGEVTHTTATEAELVAGKVMTFSTNIVSGYSGYKQYTFSSVTSGQTLNIDDVSGNYTITMSIDDAPEYISSPPSNNISFYAPSTYASNNISIPASALNTGTNDVFLSVWVATGNQSGLIAKSDSYEIYKEGNKIWVKQKANDVLSQPSVLAVDDTYVYISDTNNHRIVKRYAGNLTYVSKIGSLGSGDDQFSSPRGIAVDDTYVYISDTNNHRIVKRYAGNLTYVSKIGSLGSGNDQFSSPRGIAVDDTYVYITDTDNHRIVKRYAGNLTYVSKIGSLGSGNDQFNYPQDIAVDDTYVYISDTNNHRIVKRYAGNLTYVSKIGSLGSGNDQFSSPRGIAVDDTYVYISDTNNHRIVKRYAGNLTYVSKIGSWGSGNDQFSSPRGIAVDDTYVYITDTDNQRIVKRYAGNLTYVSKIGSLGSGNDQFSSPRGIAVDDTYVYISDRNNHRIVKRYAGNLTYVSEIGSFGSGNDQFNSPQGIAVDNEYVYISDTNNHRIVKRYAGNLTYVSKIGSFGSGNDQFNSPRGIAVDNEYVYISDTNNHRIVKRYAGNLTYVSKIGSVGSGNDQFNYPRGIAVDNEYVYISDTNNHRIVKRYAGNLLYYTDIGNAWNTILSNSLSINVFNIGIYSQQTFPGCTLYLYINGLLDSTSVDVSRNSFIEESQNMSFGIPTSVSHITVASSPTDRLQYLIGGIGVAGIANNAYSTPYDVASGVEKVLNTDATCTGIEYVDTTGGTHDVTITVYFTEDITVISDSHTTLVQTVNITHTSTNTADNGSIPYKILDGYNGVAVLSSNNTNASISRNATHFTISTGYLAAGSTYYYNVEIPRYASGGTYTKIVHNVTSGYVIDLPDGSPNAVTVAVSGAVPEYVAGIPRTGLLGEWKLDGNYLDTSGNDHHGTKIGNVQFATSYDNSQCIFINETGGYINVGTIALGNKNATLIADVKPFKTTSEKHRGIFSRYYFQNSLGLSTTGVSRHAMNNVMVFGTTPYTNTSWTQTALTYNGELDSNQLKIYENAVHVGSGTLTANIASEDRAWTIGAYGAQEPAYYFHGWIDNVRVYTQALSSEELAQIYAGGSGISFRPKPSYNWTGYNVSSGVAKTLDIDSTVTGIEVVNTAGTTLDTVTVVMHQNNSADKITAEEFFSDNWWNVSISFTPAVDYTNHRMIFMIPGNYKGQPTLSGNDTNAEISRNATHFIIDTTSLEAGHTYKYIISLSRGSTSLIVPTYIEITAISGSLIIGSYMLIRSRRK